MIIEGTTVARSCSLASVAIAVISGERDGDEIGGKLRITSSLIVSSAIAFLISPITVLGSLPGSRRQSTSAYAVSEITLILSLADSTVGVIVSRTRAFWAGSDRNVLRYSGSFSATARSSICLGPCSSSAIAW